MEFIILSASGLVVLQYYRDRKATCQIQQIRSEIESIQPQPLGSKKTTDPPLLMNLGTPPVGAPSNRSIPASLNVRTLKNDNVDETEYDEKRYAEQFFPQDPAALIKEKGWMHSLNAPYKAKEETLSEKPTPQDVMGHKMVAHVKTIEHEMLKKTVKTSSEKQHERPVEPLMTSTGEGRGFHPIGRYHKFVLNDQATIESEGGPRGAFANGSKSDFLGEYKTTTQRATMNHESFGPGGAANVPLKGAPQPSFEITASNAENWRLDDHNNANSRSLVEGPVAIPKNTFMGAHDENLDFLENTLPTGADRFATGASGTRDSEIHVPLNATFNAEFHDDVRPSFQVSKPGGKGNSDTMDVANKLEKIPEVNPQNFANTSKLSLGGAAPPVPANTIYKCAQISTSETNMGSSSRGLSLQGPINIQNAYKSSTKMEILGSTTSDKTRGLGGTSTGPSALLKSAETRTTKRVSETPIEVMVKGSGGHGLGSKMFGSHESSELRLAEESNFQTRSKIAPNGKPSEQNRSTTFNDKKENINSGSSREPILSSVGSLGTKTTGSIIESQKSITLKSEDDFSNSRQFGKRLPKGTRKSGNTDTTKNRKLGGLLNSRLGTSKLGRNVYSSKPRISGFE